jgi:hypothetical protein
MTSFDHGDILGHLPSEKLNPSFRREDQDMAEELKPQVIGPPAYASPDPRTNEGRLVPLEQHPLADRVSEDFGRRVAEDFDVDTGASSALNPSTGRSAGVGGESTDLPENRDEYSKANWQKVASDLGLSTSGSKTELRERVEAYEAELDADRNRLAAEWIEEFENAATVEDLQAIKARYDMAGAEFSTAQTAYDTKLASFEE